MKNSWKQVTASAMSLVMVVGMMPANVGTGGLFRGTELVAKAETAIPTNGSEASAVTKYVVGNVTSCSAEATGGMDIHDGEANSLFNGNGNDKLCCSFSGEMTIYFSYASTFVPGKYYIRTAGDTGSYSGRNMKYWKLQAKDASGDWVDLDVKDNSSNTLLPKTNNEAVGFELNTTTAYKDYRLTGIRTFDGGNGEKDCLFQLSEIYFEEGVDSRTNLSDATVTLANKKAIVSVNGNIVPETEYDLKFGTTVANASDTYPTSAGKYYAFVVAKYGSTDYRGIATSKPFAVVSSSTNNQEYAPYNINTTHGRSQRPSIFFEGDKINGYYWDYVTVYLDNQLMIKDKAQAYTIPKVCECVSDGYDESTYGHHEYIFYLKSVPVPIWDVSITMEENFPYVSSAVLNGKSLTLNKDYTITYKDTDGQTIDNMLSYSGDCTAVITGTNSYVDSVEGEMFYLYPYGGPEWTWNANHTASTKFVRENGADVQNVDAIIDIPVLQENGQVLYTASVSFNDEIYTDTKEVSIDENVHIYSDGDVYKIYDTEGWNIFCNCLNDSSYDGFSGKTIFIDDDVEISKVAGNFKGTFSGSENILTAVYLSGITKEQNISVKNNNSTFDATVCISSSAYNAILKATKTDNITLSENLVAFRKNGEIVNTLPAKDYINTNKLSMRLAGLYYGGSAYIITQSEYEAYLGGTYAPQPYTSDTETGNADLAYKLSNGTSAKTISISGKSNSISVDIKASDSAYNTLILAIESGNLIENIMAFKANGAEAGTLSAKDYGNKQSFATELAGLYGNEAEYVIAESEYQDYVVTTMTETAPVTTTTETATFTTTVQTTPKATTETTAMPETTVQTTPKATTETTAMPETTVQTTPKATTVTTQTTPKVTTATTATKPAKPLVTEPKIQIPDTAKTVTAKIDTEKKSVTAQISPEIVAGNNWVVFDVDNGMNIALDENTSAMLATIMEQVGSNISLNVSLEPDIEKMSSASANVVKQAMKQGAIAFDFHFTNTNNNENIEFNSNGKMVLEIPISSEQIDAFDNPNNLVVVYVDDNGNIEYMDTWCDAETGKVAFATTHNSTYMIIEDDREVDTSVTPEGWYTSLERFTEMAIKDYKNNHKNANVTANAEVIDNNTVKISIVDTKGNVADIYTIDTQTGNAKNQQNKNVKLPQTGNNSMKTAGAMGSAFGLIVAGYYAVLKSGVFRRRKKEE